MKDSMFIFEMANNHSGNLAHGLDIIKSFKEVTKKYDFKFAFKFQYRDLETLIHKDYKERQDIKYVKRFMDTRLTEEEFMTLKKAVTDNGFLAICTPFDEVSVDRVVAHGYDMIKIASCSFTDWPLLEKIALTKKPVIASTAGTALEEIDKVVSFFTNRAIDLTLMHCVGEYPTKDENLHIGQIELLKKRYPMIHIGFSTHEEPDNVDSIKMAVAMGANIFERHVAIKSDKYPINAYSSTPEQIDAWLAAAQQAYIMCGIRNERKPITEKEYNDLRGLKRGVFAKRDINEGEVLTINDVYFAIPCSENQLLANDFSKYNEFTCITNIKKDERIQKEHLSERSIRNTVLQITTKVRNLIEESGLALPKRYEMELSHHYGIEKFEEIGAAILNIINREYCKKLIVLLPNQCHPDHYHVKKEETFNVLYGDLKVVLNGKEMNLHAGDILTIERNDRHSFSSASGCIFEEISTTHYKDDSFYFDENIINNKKRKTFMPFMFGNEERSK